MKESPNQQMLPIAASAAQADLRRSTMSMRYKAITTLVMVILAMAGCIHWVNTARLSAKMKSTLNNGRGLFMLLHNSQHDPSGQPDRPIPDAATKTSTDYFIQVYDIRLRDISFAFFAAPGTAIAKDREQFTAAANAWSLNASALQSTSGSVPFLFTKNLRFSTRDGMVIASLSDEAPFGRVGAILFCADGHGRRVSQRDLTTIAAQLKPGDVEHILSP